MALNTFSPVPAPSPGTEKKPKVKILKADFGDGYTQYARDGFNWIKEVITLQWDVLLPAQADAIEAFFVNQGGDIPFLYTISDESTVKQWTCDTWSIKRGDGGIRSASATLEQNFNTAV